MIAEEIAGDTVELSGVFLIRATVCNMFTINWVHGAQRRPLLLVSLFFFSFLLFLWAKTCRCNRGELL